MVLLFMKGIRIASFVVNSLIRIYKTIRPTGKRRPGMEAQTIVVLESLNRHSGTPENATWVLDTPITNVRAFRIQDLEIPYSMYPINGYNNTLEFTDSSARTCNLTPGVYSPDELATEIQTQMNSVSSGYTVTYSDKTMRYTIANASNFTISGTSTCARLIGLAQTSGLNTSWTSDHVIDLGYTRHVLLESSLASLIDRPKVNGQSSSVVHRFPVNGNPGDVMSDPARSSCRFRVCDDRRHLSSISIKIIDDEGRVLDLQGQGFTLTLAVEYVPE